jgi:O-antigen/teichoic acid export membrane protein
MKKHFTNAAYGVADYVSYPFGMLLVAPVVLHRLGASEYGLWMVATAVVSAGGIIASGFCDANIQRVARLRSTRSGEETAQTVRSILGINLVLGVVLGVLVWFAAPPAALRIAAARQLSLLECLISLRIAGALILVRAVESVAVSTQRAYEQYRTTVEISVASRLLTLACAAVLALEGLRAVSLLVATGVFLLLGCCVQFVKLWQLLDGSSLWPTFHPESTRALLKFGAFVWFQALGGVIFAQCDRVLLGVSMGAKVVAPYSLCVQFTQPVCGLAASGLNFLFPYLSGRIGTISAAELRRTVLKAMLCNFAAAAGCSVILLLVGDRIIRLWAGTAVAQSAAPILPLILLGSALTGLSVTGIYALQSLGQFRTVSFIGLGSRLAMLPVMICLLHHMGLYGLAISRVCLGSIALLVYVPLARRLFAPAARTAAPPTFPLALQEEPKL